MTSPKRWLFAGLLGLLAAGAVRPDELDDTKARLAIEAQRVERLFAADRLAAYKMVRGESPDLIGATEKLQGLRSLVRADTSLDDKRRQLLVVTLKADLERVGAIAGERRRASAAAESRAVAQATREEVRRDGAEKEGEPARRVSDDARSVIESRRRALDESRVDRTTKSDRLAAVNREVMRSAIPEGGDIRFSRDWPGLSRRRSVGQKMTAKEAAIMKVLDSTLDADYSKNTFEEVLEHLRKVTKVDIAVDKRALEEVGAGYESTVTVKMKSSVRTILRRVLADMNLAYVVKDEAIQITSKERASKMTTARTYYLGDLAAVVDTSVPPFLSRIAAQQNINNIVNLITSTVEPDSWKVNNPEASGVIAFDPITMSLVVKQTAEVHYKLGLK